MSKTIQNYYVQKLSLDWSVGTGIFYVTVKPTVSDGWLVISPNNTNLVEIVKYTSTGSDTNGDYVVVSQRGVGGTTEQTHTIGEPIRMNITAEYWQDMNDAIDSIVAAGAPNAATDTKGIVEEATAAEIDSLTETGTTGAPLFINPKLLGDAKNIPHVPPGTSGNLMTSNGTDWVSSGLTFLTFKNGNTTYDITTASGVQNIAHGLGVIPKVVKLTGVVSQATGSSSSWTVYNGTTQSSVYVYKTDTTEGHGATFSLVPNSISDSQSGVVTFDDTNIIITWTKTGAPNATANIMWEAV